MRRARNRLPLVGVLVSTGLHPLDYLRQGLRELGFVEGQNVVFAFRSADGNPRDLPGLARHLASLKPAVLFCAGPAALDAAVHATSSVPIVALDLETDPLRSGLVRSLEQPRTNVTGLFLDQPAIAGRWFELLRQAVPKAQRINLLWDASTGPWQLAAAKAAAQKLQLRRRHAGGARRKRIRAGTGRRPEPQARSPGAAVVAAGARALEADCRVLHAAPVAGDIAVQ